MNGGVNIVLRCCYSKFRPFDNVKERISKYRRVPLRERVADVKDRISRYRRITIPGRVADVKDTIAKYRPRVANVKDKILTIPNGLCIGRLFATPFIGYLVVTEHYIPACGLFVVAGLTDMLDGYIARTYPTQKSMLGSILDPLADKFLISTLFVTLAYSGLIPVLLTAVVLSRDIILIIGGLIKRYQILEPPLTFNRFFDTSISSVNIKPTLVSKLNTGLQLLIVTLSLASPIFGFEHHPLLMTLCILTGGTTIYSGLQYANGNAMIPAKLISKKFMRRIRKRREI